MFFRRISSWSMIPADVVSTMNLKEMRDLGVLYSLSRDLVVLYHKGLTPWGWADTTLLAIKLFFFSSSRSPSYVGQQSLAYDVQQSVLA